MNKMKDNPLFYFSYWFEPDLGQKRLTVLLIGGKKNPTFKKSACLQLQTQN